MNGAKTLVCLHTVQPLLGLLDDLVAELLPEVALLHILDEPLLAKVRQRGRWDSEDVQRIQTHRELAEQVGAAAMLVTCSTVSSVVEDVRIRPGIPVYRIDEVMINQAVTIGGRIGVVATIETTLNPTRELLIREAEQLDRKIAVELILVPDALQLLLSGKGEEHDNLVRQSVLEISERSDVVVLAQASMARVLATIPETERETPVFSSPHLALELIREQLFPGD